jgi:YD repeat-containing protein
MFTPLTAIVDQAGSRLTYTLDAMGNRNYEAITRPDNTYVYYAHSRTFDALDRLWQDIGAANQTVTYQYDAQGNLKQIDGARTDVADVTSHGYDALDRLIQTLNADGGIEQYKPNTLLSYTYDSTGRLTSASDSAANSFGSLAWTYDQSGNRQSETRSAGTMTISSRSSSVSNRISAIARIGLLDFCTTNE